MRYFEDGDLTLGLKVAPKSRPVDVVEGEWHITWAHVDGNQRTTNYDEPNALLAMGMTVRAIEPSDKRKKTPNENISVELRFCQWGLEYRGHYNTEGPATKLSLTQNSTPDKVDADDDAYLVFGAVRDDEDFPFMSFMTAVLPREAHLDHYQNMEFVAKKTDEVGIHPLELTRNERLRLGFKMNNDGVFEDFAHPSSSADILSYLQKDRRPGAVTASLGETYTKLMTELKDHTEARERIKNQLRVLKKRMDSEYKDLNLSPSPSPTSQRKSAVPSHAPTPGRTARAAGPLKRTVSGTAKAPQRRRTIDGAAPKSRKRRRQQTARARESIQKKRRATLDAPVNGNVASSDEGAESDSEASSEEEGDAGSRFSATAPDATGGASSAEDPIPPTGRGRGGVRPQPRGEMRRCDLCQKEVTSKNWGVHINTNIHKNNVARAKVDGHVDEDEEDGTPPPKKSRRKEVNGDDDARPSPLSPNKLKRPSNTLLRGGAVGIGRGRPGPSPSP